MITYEYQDPAGGAHRNSGNVIRIEGAAPTTHDTAPISNTRWDRDTARLPEATPTAAPSLFALAVCGKSPFSAKGPSNRLLKNSRRRKLAVSRFLPPEA